MRLRPWTAALMAAAALGGCELPGAYDPKAATDRYVDGQIHAEQGRYDQALAELAKAIEADPDMSVAHEAIGDIHRQRGSFELARTAYEAACRTNPYAFRPHYNLGVTYQMLADAARAVEQTQDYLRRAVDVYLRAISIRPDDFEANLNLSACYFQTGKFRLAEQYCREAIRLSPTNAAAHSNLGIIFDSQDRLYEAINAYKRSLELDSHQPRILLNLGSTYMRQRRFKMAVMAFTAATRENGEMSEPWAQIGSCHYHLGDYPKALEAYRRAAGIDPSNPEAYRGIGVVQMTQFISDTKKTALRDQALRAWNTSLELKADQPDLLRLVRKYTPERTGPEL